MATQRQHDHSHEGHGHQGHGHGHVHASTPASFGFAFAIGTVLNLGFVAVEALYGVLSNSVSLLADAGHNFSDVIGLVMAWGAYLLAKRRPSATFTFGLGKSSILAALFNALLLLVAIGGIAWEAVQRLGHPEPVATGTVMIVAAVGILINGFTAWLFAAGRKGDLNVRGAFLHMLADAAVSAGVVFAAFVMSLTGWLWVDPVVSLLVNAVILWGTWGLLRQSLAMAMAGVPEGVNVAQVKAYLGELPGVKEVHDLHIWPISTTEIAMSCHLVMPGGHPGGSFLLRATAGLKEHFGINHPAFQIEIDETVQCPFAPDEVI